MSRNFVLVSEHLQVFYDDGAEDVSPPARSGAEVHRSNVER
jgi:hypothetical protein